MCCVLYVVCLYKYYEYLERIEKRMNNIQPHDNCYHSVDIGKIKDVLFKFISKEFNFMNHNEMKCFLDKILNDDIVKKEIESCESLTVFVCKELVVLRFYKNLKIMRPYIGNILKQFNLDLDNDIDVELCFELMKSLFYANRTDLISMISNFCSDISKYKTFGEYGEACLGKAILNVWIISFEELVEHFRDVVSDLNIKNLHYDLKRKISIIDKILWNLQTRICENVEVLLLDSSYNVIYSIGKEFGQHYLEKIIYPDLNKIILCNSIDNVITLSSDKNYKRTKLYNINCLHFSDRKKVAGYNLMYPIIANKRLYGYLLFHTLNFDFNKHDYNYILSLIK